MRHITDIWTKW